MHQLRAKNAWHACLPERLDSVRVHMYLQGVFPTPQESTLCRSKESIVGYNLKDSFCCTCIVEARNLHVSNSNAKGNETDHYSAGQI